MRGVYRAEDLDSAESVQPHRTLTRHWVEQPYIERVCARYELAMPIGGGRQFNLLDSGGRRAVQVFMRTAPGASGDVREHGGVHEGWERQFPAGKCVWCPNLV